MLFNTEKHKEIRKYIEYSSKTYENSSANIVAVTKTHPIETVEEAIRCGIVHFGENKVQEAYNKFKNIKIVHKNIYLHMIGPLQTNKVKKALKFLIFFTRWTDKI